MASRPKGPTPELAADAPEYEPERGCSVDTPHECPMLARCRRRLELSLTAIVLCEIPDQLDKKSMEAEGFPFVEMEVS